MQEKKLILVVDDDRMNLSRAESLLQEQYHTVCVISGEQALKFLTKRHPDLILLDIEMPGMDGYEVIKRIKEDKDLEKIPVFFLTANTDKETEVRCFEMGAVDFLCKPFEPAVMLTRVNRTLELEDYRKGLELYKKKLEEEVQEQAQRIVRIQQEVIIGMANLIESRDGSTGEHVKRTTTYTKMLTERLLEKERYKDTLTGAYAVQLVKAAAMHDIGKIKVPDSILQKAGSLTQEEYELMKEHTTEGGRLVKKTMGKIEEPDYVQIAYDVASAHHERWNGTGYPAGLRGDQIPLSARIVAIADVFDALVSKRHYKESMSVEDALEIVKSYSGTYFDPDLVEEFVGMKEQLKEQAEEFLGQA